MADERQIEIREEPNPRATVKISFQKGSRRLKYLEAEPKILGTTQIVLGFFLTSIVVAVWHVSEEEAALSMPINIVAIIAGSLGIAAQNLHPPTIKACLGMQVLTCVASVITFLIANLIPDHIVFSINCDGEQHNETICESFQEVIGQLQFLQKLVMAVQIALSATLAAYCCKVVECCSPSSGVPVITVERPADAQ